MQRTTQQSARTPPLPAWAAPPTFMLELNSARRWVGCRACAAVAAQSCWTPVLSFFPRLASLPRVSGRCGRLALALRPFFPGWTAAGTGHSLKTLGVLVPLLVQLGKVCVVGRAWGRDAASATARARACARAAPDASSAGARPRPRPSCSPGGCRSRARACCPRSCQASFWRRTFLFLPRSCAAREWGRRGVQQWLGGQHTPRVAGA